MKDYEMHAKKILKRANYLENLNYIGGFRDVILRGDSKVRSFMGHVYKDPYMNIAYRPGAKIDNSFLQYHTLHRVRRSFRPIVVIWMGTCELTDKRGRFIRLVDNLEEKLDYIRTSYMNYKEQVLKANGESTVIFLECPYMNVEIWNRTKNHPSPDVFKFEQEDMETAVDKLNLIFKEINGEIRTPRLAQDFTDSHRKRKNKPRQYYKNYKILTDGVHPDKPVAKLWYLRLVKMIALL